MVTQSIDSMKYSHLDNVDHLLLGEKSRNELIRFVSNDRKRKRLESSSTSSQSSSDSSPLDVLHRLCVSTTHEEFSSPLTSTFPFQRQCFCPICKSSIRRFARETIQCDFCPLIYHLDCLKCSKPLDNELWMCPNHHSPLIDRISMKTKCQRVRIRHHRPTNEPIRIRQDFLSSTSTLEISEIPSTIEHLYSSIETTDLHLIEKIIDEIVQHVSKEKFYSFESLSNETHRESQTISIDLRQFRSSHAALIHFPSERVIYLRKHVIWFGSSPSIDIDLHRYSSSTSTHRCSAISERHACLYYDRKQNRFELLNYSEFGTIVDDLRYGIDENLLESNCICQQTSSSNQSWNGSAFIDQGTRFQIGCHRFVFYRYIQR